MADITHYSISTISVHFKKGVVLKLDDMLDLIKQAKKGDKQAYGQIYESIYHKLYKVAIYTLGNKEDAEDVVSETFIEGYRGISKLKDEKAFKSWMYKILSARCKRKIKNYIADRENKIQDDISEIDYGIGIDNNEQHLNRIDLLSALSKISPEERQLVVLATVEGYKMREIADITNSPLGTVTSKIHRALKKLKSNLKGREIY